MTNGNLAAAADTVDVLIIGAGPSGAVVANEMARNGFYGDLPRTGRWFNNNEFPGDKPEWELLSQQKWSHDPNIRKTAEDYPLAVDDSDLHPVMIGGVGGSTLFYGGHWMRLLPSDFRMYIPRRRRRRLAVDLRRPRSLLRQDRSAPSGCPESKGDPMYPAGHGAAAAPAPDRQGRSPRGSQGMNKLGWHWWPAPNAIASQQRGRTARCVRFGTCETGCPEGAKASFDITHWPAAIKHGAQLDTQMPGPPDHHRQRAVAPTARSTSTPDGVEHDRRRGSSCWRPTESAPPGSCCCPRIAGAPTDWRTRPDWSASGSCCTPTARSPASTTSPWRVGSARPASRIHSLRVL